MRQRFRVANGALIVDGERLIGRQDVVLADVAEERCAIAIGRLDANHLLVQAAFVDLGDVRGLREHRRILVDVDDADVDVGTRRMGAIAEDGNDVELVGAMLLTVERTLGPQNAEVVDQLDVEGDVVAGTTGRARVAFDDVEVADFRLVHFDQRRDLDDGFVLLDQAVVGGLEDALCGWRERGAKGGIGLEISDVRNKWNTLAPNQKCIQIVGESV